VLYSLAYWLVRIVLGACFRIEVKGREHVPEGACLVVRTHLSWLDTAFIIYALPPRPMVHTMANRTTVFNTRFKRWLLPKLGVFPVSRQRGFLDGEAVNTVYNLLESGERVLIFPEGAYGKDGELRPLKEGIGHFAINSGRPLLPIVLTGTGRLRPFSRVVVDIGEPFIPKPPRMWDVKRRVRAAVDSVAQAFQKMGSRIRPTPADPPAVSAAEDVSHAAAVKVDHPDVARNQPRDDEQQAG
jgi:1-acyl-sn-glycerol-3-phosphate acyltransferase